ncbi:MAG: ubiquinol-cytochrome c reductase iron-sulfur subunit [Planctomycetota bacterium]
MAEKKKMSVAEILAAARAADGKGASPAAKPKAEPPADAGQEEAAAPAAPAAAPAPPRAASAGGRPSVADILAMARAKQEPGAPAAKPAAEAKPAAKPAAKAAAAKPAAPAAAAGTKGVQRDTASILAAARSAVKPGPVSKAEAPVRPAEKPKPAAAAVAKPAPRAVPPKPTRPPQPAKQEEGEDRRSFLQIATGSFLAVGFTALSVTGGLFSLGLARFFFPNVLAEPPSKFKVGFKEGFPAGKVETKYVAQYGVWVVNGEVQGQQQIYALKTVCTHLGCTPSWLEAEQKFKCPCHGSGFYKDGVNFEGPAPRPLERYAIRIADDGQLEVDKSRTFQEELGQWADPASYVTA